MFKSAFGCAFRTATEIVRVNTNALIPRLMFSSFRQINAPTQLLPKHTFINLTPLTINNFLLPSQGLQATQQQSVRSVTKFSLKKGKRKCVKAVIKRFKRLHWGAWIRTRCGRHKKMFKKSAKRKRRLRQHIFTNATQSWLLDKMVTSFWRRPKYYIDDPYEPYHKRDEYFATKSRTLKV